MPQGAGSKLKVIQVGMNTSDMVGSLRLFHEAFGFVNAGSAGMWGNTIAVQGLPPDARTLIWWMIGRQKFFQLEMFHHTNPPQRPLRKDWKPADHGWVRMGIGVADFDAAVKALGNNGVKTLTPSLGEKGQRRIAYRDPFVGNIVEVIEKTALTGGPEIVYVASSVSDLGAARKFYSDVLGLEIMGEQIHEPAHEALWGLDGAKRDTFVARAGDVLLEIVQYHTPKGRPRASDYRISDQGLTNICLGTREPAVASAAIARAKAAGIEPPVVFEGGGIVWGQLSDPEREVEIGCMPEAADAAMGFTAVAPFQT